MRRRVSRCALVAQSLLLVWPGWGLGQSADDVAPASLAVDEKSFREGFGDRDVSSSVLVALTAAVPEDRGYMWAYPAIIVAEGLPDATGLCLRTNTVDGQFWSENPFNPPSGYARWGIERLSVRYQDLLEDYGPEEILIAAGLARREPHRDGGDDGEPENTFDDACRERRLVYAPAAVPADPAEEAGNITAFVNSQSRPTTATLSYETGTPLRVNCRTPAQGGNVLYDRVCELPHRGPAGVYTVTFEFDAAPFGSEKSAERIALPSSPSD